MLLARKGKQEVQSLADRMGLTRDDSNSSFFDDSVHAGKKLFTHDGAWKGLPDGTVRDTKA